MFYRYIALTGCLVAFLISSCCKRDNSQKHRPSATRKTGFFTTVPLAFSSNGSPYLDVQIDNKIFSMKLDLGLRGDLSIAHTFIDQIPSKQFMHKKPMYGFKGKEYPTNFYRIPKVTIGTISFTQPILQENCEESRKDSVIIQTGSKPPCQGAGRIGWELFCDTKVLVDVKNSQIAFCDSLDTLKKSGYTIENFIKTPLITERGLVELEVQTLNRSLRCVLDTGSTWNILNAEIGEGKSIEQILWEPSNMLEYPSFTIGKEEFGPMAFHRIPIKLPIRIDAILGIEFFEDHLIFFDFSENYVYILKNQ